MGTTYAATLWMGVEADRPHPPKNESVFDRFLRGEWGTEHVHPTADYADMELAFYAAQPHGLLVKAAGITSERPPGARALLGKPLLEFELRPFGTGPIHIQLILEVQREVAGALEALDIHTPPRLFLFWRIYP